MDADTIVAILIVIPFIIYFIFLLKSDYENSQPITPEQRESNLKKKKAEDKQNEKWINEWAEQLEADKKTYVVLISQLDENDDGDMEDLQLSVGVFIKRGWKLQGGVYENSDARYCQAMTKEYE